MEIVSRSLAALMLIILSPFFLLISAGSLLFQGFPILYKQERVGFKFNLFNLYKFRTMKINNDNKAVTETGDSRITTWGTILRKLKLDELPQLWSILKGDMSFVGPRPALFNQNDLITLRSENGLDQLLPGLTGWAQVNGRDELSIPEKVALEVEYMQKKSFWFYLKILWMTFLKVINNQGISH